MDHYQSRSGIPSTMLISGAEHPDQPITIAAGELFEWGWLLGELGDWLNQVDGVTRAHFAEFFDGHRDTAKTAWFLTHMAERIGGLLDGDVGQP